MYHIVCNITYAIDKVDCKGVSPVIRGCGEELLKLGRLHISAGFLHIPAGFLLELFQLKEPLSFCEGMLKKSRTDHASIHIPFLKERALASFK